MGYKLQEKLELVVEFEQSGRYVEFPFESNTNTLTELSMCESTKFIVPTVFLQLQDGCGFFKEYPMIDGQRVRVSLAVQGQVTKSRIFRIYSQSVMFDGVSDTAKIDGYLDCPIYRYTSSCAGYNMTTASAIQQIASQCGFKSDVAQTSDKQIWMQGNRTYSDFVTYLTQHGYAGAYSYMVSGLTLDSVLKYRDVNNINDPPFNMIVHSSRDGYIACTDINVSSNSGLTNGFGGYASTLVDMRDNVERKDLTVKKNNRVLSVNTDLVRAIKRSNINYSLYRADLSPNYWDATYQNDRYARLYNVTASLMITLPSNVTLLSSINLAIFDQTGEKVNAKDSGSYIVDTRTIYIRGINYAERITATRMGIN